MLSYYLLNIILTVSNMWSINSVFYSLFLNYSADILAEQSNLIKMWASTLALIESIRSPATSTGLGTDRAYCHYYIFSHM